MTMTIGTKSILFGAHAFYLHPWFVALAWWRLFGFPTDPRLWVAFIVHDWGYWGCANMDDAKGEEHPYVGASIMFKLFDAGRYKPDAPHWSGTRSWHGFTLYHSRFLAKRDRVAPSMLCIADKLAIALEPWWLYLPRVWLSGELAEYMTTGPTRDPRAYPGGYVPSARQWHRQLVDYMAKWVETHRDGAEDTWTQRVG